MWNLTCASFTANYTVATIPVPRLYRLNLRLNYDHWYRYLSASSYSFGTEVRWLLHPIDFKAEIGKGFVLPFNLKWKSGLSTLYIFYWYEVVVWNLPLSLFHFYEFISQFLIYIIQRYWPFVKNYFWIGSNFFSELLTNNPKTNLA